MWTSRRSSRWLAGILRIFGDNLVVLHFFSALANAALIVVTGLMARELGGGRVAQVLAALASAAAVVFIGTGSLYHDGRLRRAVVGAGGVRLHPAACGARSRDSGSSLA